MTQQNGQYRFTSILVQDGGRKRVYRSLEDMPAPDRASLLEATRGDRSATILIADEAGERFLKDLVRSRLRQPDPEPPASGRRFWHTTGWRWTVEVAICSGAASLLWFLATIR